MFFARPVCCLSPGRCRCRDYGCVPRHNNYYNSLREWRTQYSPRRNRRRSGKHTRRSGWLVGAERNVRRCAFADFGNSPFDYTPEKVSGKDLVFTTTNGTKAIHCAAKAHSIAIGAFVNLQAVAQYCISTGCDVVVLCSGWTDKINIEDTLFGGALVETLMSAHYEPAGDAAHIALSLWKEAKNDLYGYFMRTEHIRRLLANGLERDIPYCLTLDSIALTPVYLTDKGILTTSAG